jgi:leucyl aminopeptidase
MSVPIRLSVRRSRQPSTEGTDLLVVPVSEGDLASDALKKLDRAVGGGLLRHAKDAGFRAQPSRILTHRTPANGRSTAIVLVGLGKDQEATSDSWRRAGGASAGAARAEAAADVAVFVFEDDGENAVAFAEGFALTLYRFDAYRKPDPERRREPRRLTIAGPTLDARRLAREVEALAATVAAVFAVRDLVNEPPSAKAAAVLAKRAVSLCRGSGVRVEVLGPTEIRRLRLNGLLAVNRGSIEPPRFLRLRYRPRGRVRSRVALVGKGVTFDSGGLSLKPAKSMESMKIDMAGGAAVIGAMAVAGRLKLPVAVTGYVPLTDNLPSGSAQKPGDVIRYRNGKCVEVLNTDAEGRLILADALLLACEDENDVVIDLATLTGACMVALGNQVAGILGNDNRLVESLVAHGRAAGEPLWPLPLFKDYRDELKSSVADLKNVGGGYGGTITAALFLNEFVNGAAWAHLDIAGPAYTERDLPYCPRGGTGFGIRTLVRYLRSL